MQLAVRVPLRIFFRIELDGLFGVADDDTQPTLQVFVLRVNIQANSPIGSVEVNAKLSDGRAVLADVRTQQLDVVGGLDNLRSHGALELVEGFVRHAEDGNVHFPGIVQVEVAQPVPCPLELKQLPFHGFRYLLCAGVWQGVGLTLRNTTAVLEADGELPGGLGQ